MMVLRLFLPVFLVALLAVACGSPRESEPERPPRLRNLVLISIDTQRADRLAFYGGDVETPNLAKLAARGAIFERAYSHAAMTGPSHSSLFTSRWVSEHGVKNNGQVLPAEQITLAELLQGQGMRTGAFVSLATFWNKFGLDAGFDTYVDEPTRKAWWLTASEVNALALPWIEQNRAEPFFAFVHYSDPHEPYVPPAWVQEIGVEHAGEAVKSFAVDGRRTTLRVANAGGETRLDFTLRGDTPVRVFDWRAPRGVTVRAEPRTDKGELFLEPDTAGALFVRDQREGEGERPLELRLRAEPLLAPDARRSGYDLETREVDAAIGELIALLDRLALWDDTAIVVTADHGEELGEREGRFGHTHHLVESVIRVPLVIVAPGAFDPGTRVSEVVRHVDLLPTLADLFGFSAPEGVRGRSLWPAEAIGERIAVAETWRPQARQDRIVAVGSRFKLERAGEDAVMTLYDLEGDPAEVAPIRAPESDSPAARVWPVLETALSRVVPDPRKPTSEIPLEDEDRDALRALGYIE